MGCIWLETFTPSSTSNWISTYLHPEQINSSKDLNFVSICALSAANAKTIQGSGIVRTEWGVVGWLAVAKMEMARR